MTRLMQMGTDAYVGSFPVASRFVAVIGDEGSVSLRTVLESLENFFDARRIAMERMRAEDG